MVDANGNRAMMVTDPNTGRQLIQPCDQMGNPTGPPQDPNQQSFEQMQAQAHLAHMEEETKRHAEEKKQHEVDKMAHQLRAVTRDHEDAKTCAKSICMWALLNGICYALALMGDGWAIYTFHAASVDEFTLTNGLFNIEFDLRCKETMTGTQPLCDMMKPWAQHDQGWWTTTEFMDKVCHESKTYCITAQRLYWSGFFPLVLLPAAAIFECLSMLLCWFYWHVKPTRSMREMSLQCATAATVCAAFGFVGWFAMRPWMSGMPSLLGSLSGQKEAVQGMLTGFKETWRLPFGASALCGLGAMLSSLIRVVSQYGLSFHKDEPDPFGLGERDALISQATHQAETSYAATHPHHH